MHKSDTKTFGRSGDEKDLEIPPPQKEPHYMNSMFDKKKTQNKQLTANI